MRSFFQCRELTRREQVLLVAMLLAGVTILACWRPIGRWFLVRFVLQAEAPTQAVVNDIASRAKAPVALLNQLWETGKIPHRLAVLTYLKENPGTDRLLLKQAGDLLLAATQDGDFEAKEMALTLLSSPRHPALLRLATAQLSDLDPAVRVLGLKHLCKTDNPQLGGQVVPLLDDPDPRVVVMAGITLRNWFSNDFGIRIIQAAPQFDVETQHSANPEAVAALALGVQRWKDWWNAHRADYSSTPEKAVQSTGLWELPLAEFSAEDLSGERVGLSDFRGRPVLVTFWDSRTTNNDSWLSTLAGVQRRNQERVRIVGIWLDATAQPGGHDHGQGHQHEAPPPPNPAAIRARVRAFARDQHLDFAVLMDAKGAIGRRFSAEVMPTNLLIDRDGHLRRRFLGPRTPATLEAMIDEVERSRCISKSKAL